MDRMDRCAFIAVEMHARFQIRVPKAQFHPMFIRFIADIVHGSTRDLFRFRIKTKRNLEGLNESLMIALKSHRLRAAALSSDKSARARFMQGRGANENQTEHREKFHCR